MAFIHKNTFKIYNDSKIGNNRLSDIDAFFEVDDILAPVISKLNIRGYSTKYSCQGHPYRSFSDDIVTMEPGESLQEAIHRGHKHQQVNHIVSISEHTNYVFYESDTIPRIYITFEKGISLPTIPQGWKSSLNQSQQLTIAKEYTDKCTYLGFFTQMIDDIRSLLIFVEDLPICTNSLDEEWNECALELISKLPNITDVEIDMIRQMYTMGKETDQILNTLVRFSDSEKEEIEE